MGRSVEESVKVHGKRSLFEKMTDLSPLRVVVGRKLELFRYPAAQAEVRGLMMPSVAVRTRY